MHHRHENVYIKTINQPSNLRNHKDSSSSCSCCFKSTMINSITSSILLLLLLTATANAADPLYTICSTTGNYKPQDSYDRSLDNVLTNLKKNTPPTGFSFASSNGQAYGLALCRGDVSSSDCSICVADAATQIKQTCPTQKEAIVWFDNCLLRYSNTNFYGVPYDGTDVYIWNVGVVPNPTTFNTTVVALLKTASAKAYGSRLLFGTAETDAGSGLGKLYSLAQCSRDLSAANCKSCLEKVVNQYPSCCDGKKGGRVLDGSCNFRYELYPFYGVV